MESDQLKQAITTSKNLNESAGNRNNKKAGKELENDNARFSKVRRMTNKDKQRQEFEQMADNKASKAI